MSQQPSLKDLESFESEYWILGYRPTDVSGTVYQAHYRCKFDEDLMAVIHFSRTPVQCTLRYKDPNWVFLFLFCRDRKMPPRDIAGHLLDEKFGKRIDKIEAFLANTTFDGVFSTCNLCGTRSTGHQLTYIDFINNHYKSTPTKSATKGL